MNRLRKIIISGGGTGGHIFPAISIANEIKRREPEADILFVGAVGRMEMEKIPAAGYKIVGLPVTGLNRKKIWKNILVIIRLLRSMTRAKKIVKEFKPNVVVGVGGYASGPILKKANNLGIPTILQEQNSYAGVTNKILAKKAKKICVAYDGMDRYFPEKKIVLTGNPVRSDVIDNLDKKTEEALKYFQLNRDKQVLLIVGGSLGSSTLNQSMIKNIELLNNSDIQVIWQTGSIYFKKICQQLEEYDLKNIRIVEFIDRMDYVYSIASVVISRAGAIAISELCLVGKPVILVPSPNVAEDHQTKNAKSLVDKKAAILIKDENAPDELIKKAIELMNNKDEKLELSANIKKLRINDSVKKIVDEIYKLIE